MKMKQNGSSLPEALIVVALMGIIAVVATIGMNHVSTEAKSKDLRQDVASLNRAVGVYLTSGGSLMNPLGSNAPKGLTIEEAVVQKLKTIADSAQSEEINGFRGSVIDSRMTPVVHREEDGEPENVLVVWNPGSQRFEVSEMATEGVKKFVYDDELVSAATQGEVRAPSMRLAKVDDWIWDHDAHTIEVGEGPSYIGNTGGYGGPGGFSPESPNALALNQPIYSQPGGFYELVEFDKTISLQNPNPVGTSQIVYSVDGGAWKTYQGEEITVTLDTTLDAIAVTLDPDHWIDSDPANEFYDGEPVQLELEILTAQDAYTYSQVGGENIGDAVSPLASATDPAVINLSNIDAIPSWVLDMAQVRADYARNTLEAVDGTSYLTSENSSIEIDISLDHWASDGIVIGVSGESENGLKYIEASNLETKSLAIVETLLREPISSVEGGVFTTNEFIQFKRDHLLGDMPKGARILVSIDGSDPLDENGDIAAGAVEITDGLELESEISGSGDGFVGGVNAFDELGEGRTITARVLPPAGYKNWFTPSAPVELNFQPYVPKTWNGFIVGDFEINETRDFLNIKQNTVDGPLDQTFDPGVGFDMPVKDIAVDYYGNVVAVGYFTSFNGTARNRIARLKPDGTLDTTFDPGAGFDLDAECVAIQDDGKILVGGDFTSFDGSARNRIARLNEDGTLDTTFDPGAGADNDVYALAIQNDGKIVVGGNFTQFGAAGRNYICRVNSDGSLDNSFLVGESSGANMPVFDVAVQNDGKVVVVGNFSSLNGVKRVRVGRLESDGSLDTGFTVGRGANKEVYTVSLFEDGGILIGGRFSSYDKKVRKGVAKINPDGSRDDSWDIGNGDAIPSWRLYDSAITADGKVVVGGRLTAYNPNSRSAFKRLNQDGTIDDSFGAEDLPQGAIIYGVAIKRNSGAIVLGGDFNHTENVGGHRDIAKLNKADGSLDESFDVGTGTNHGSYVSAVVRQDDGKLIVGGNFLSVQGVDRRRIARINADGIVDSTFYAEFEASDEGFFKIDFENPASLEHGSVISQQYEAEYGLSISASNNLAPDHPDLAVIFDTNRSNTDDPDLESPWAGGNISQLPLGLYTDFGNALVISENDIDVDGDGLIDNPSDEAGGGAITFSLNRTDIVGFRATFIDFEETSEYSIRLTQDNLDAAVVEFGEFIDPSSLWYDPYLTVGNNFVNILPNLWADEVGLDYFTEVTFEFAGSGALDDLYFITDRDFDPGNVPEAEVFTLALQPDGKVLVGGRFGRVNGLVRNNLVRLNSDGSVDDTFGLLSGFDGVVRSIDVDKDGNILVGGEFSSYQGLPAAGLARLFPDGTLDASVNGVAGSLVAKVLALPGGRIAYAGNFTAPSAGVALLDADGSVLETFSTGDGGGNVSSISLQTDGKLVIGGGFETWDGGTHQGVVRLLPNGAVDPSFISTNGADGDVHAVHVLPDDKIVIVGEFANYGGLPHSGVARLNNDGSVDQSLADSTLEVRYISDTK